MELVREVNIAIADGVWLLSWELGRACVWFVGCSALHDHARQDVTQLVVVLNLVHVLLLSTQLSCKIELLSIEECILWLLQKSILAKLRK